MLKWKTTKSIAEGNQTIVIRVDAFKHSLAPNAVKQS